MLRKALAVLALIPLALGAGHQEEFEVLLEDMIEKVSPVQPSGLTHWLWLRPSSCAAGNGH